MGEFVFLDWNATAPIAPESLAAMVETASTTSANPSSVHRAGRLARRVVEDLREELARTLEASPRDVVLTGSGTEANNIAVRSPFVDGHGVLLTSRLEHPSVTRVAEALEREGRARVHWVRVTDRGVVDLDDVRACLARGGVRLVAMQAVNQETGVVQPIEDVYAECIKAGVALHVDAVQALGRTATPLLGTTRTIAAHKLRGPKGIGAIVGSCGHRLHPVLLGGAQERGLRPGTLDPMAAAGFLVALRNAHLCRAGFEAQRERRDRLEASILKSFPGSEVNGQVSLRLAHVSNVALAGMAGAEAVVALDLEGVGISSGSACSAGTLEPSPVIATMHDAERARRSVRVSLGPTTTDDDLGRSIDAFERVASRLGS